MFLDYIFIIRRFFLYKDNSRMTRGFTLFNLNPPIVNMRFPTSVCRISCKLLLFPINKLGAMYYMSNNWVQDIFST